MSIEQPGKILPPQSIIITLFICLILLFQSPLKGLHIQSSAWAGDPGWNNAFDSSPKKNSPSSRKSGTPGNSWNTVIDNNTYNTKIDNDWKTGKSSESTEQVQPQTPNQPQADIHENQPTALALIDTLLTANQPAEIPQTLYINNMTKVQYAGAVSMAMEGMRLFCGDMDEEQEGIFKSRWLPLFRYPSPEIVFYINQLNPLLVKFLALRAAINDCLEDFNATQLAVMSCAEIGDAFGVSQAMDSAVIYALVGKVLNARLQLVGENIIALGEPPNAAGLMKKAQQKHEDAFKEFFQNPLISITPSNLKAVPGREYTFKIEIDDYDNYKRKDKLSLTCQGREKIENGVLIIKKTFHKKIGTNEKFTVQLHQYPGPKILATVTADITMVKNPGCWTLVDCHTYETGEESFLLTYTIDKEECRIESSLTPPSYTGKNFHFGCLNSWKAPPQRLFPKTKMQIPVNITRLQPPLTCEKFSEESFRKLAHNAYNAHGKEKVKILKDLSDCNTCLTNCGTHKNPCGGCEKPDPPSIQLSLFTDLELSKQAENNPWTTGSLNSSATQLKNGAFKTQALLTQIAPNGIPEDRYNKDKPNSISFHVQITNGFFYSKDANYHNSGACPRFRVGVVYVYKWDPSGNQIKPLDLGSQNATGAPANPSEVLTSKQEKAEKIIFHQHNIKYFATNIKALKKQLKNTDDPQARDKLTRNLLYAQDAQQREIDAITTIQTGQFVRTRTAIDALNMKIMADESHKLVAHFHTLKRILERGPRLIDLAPRADQLELRKFFHRNITAKYISTGKSEKLYDTMKALGNRVLGAIEVEKEKHEEDADFYDRQLCAAQNVKTFTDYSLMALSFATTGPTAAYTLFGNPGVITSSGVVFTAYSGASGYFEKGIGEGVSRMLSSFNACTIITDAGMRGYQTGVLQNLEEYAQNPQKVALDEEKAGFTGAAWSAGSAAAFSVAIKFGMRAYQNRQQTIKNREFLNNLKYDKAIKDSQVRHFKRRTIAGAKKVKTFRHRQEALSRAGQANAPKSEILKLRCELDKAYKDIKTDYFAKKIMKSMATKAKASYKTASGRAHHKTVHAYNSADTRFTKQLKTKLSERMSKAGYSKQEYKTFSNSASKGGIGMDVDIGAKEPPRYKIKGGKKVRNPEHDIWRKNITRKVNGKTSSLSPQDLQKAGQKQLKAAFKDVYGRKSGEAMVEFTTSYHPEAYRDPRWLGSKQSKTALVYKTDSKWTQQAADVTDFKVNTMDKHNPSMGYYGRMQENCRGVVKDFNTKLQPLFKHSTNPKAVKHMKKLKDVMERFANNKIGPVKAEQMLRMLTGNKDGIREVSKRFSLMLQGLKMPGASAR